MKRRDILRLSSLGLGSTALLCGVSEDAYADSNVLSEITLPEGGARGLGVLTGDPSTFFTTHDNITPDGYYILEDGSLNNSFSLDSSYDGAGLSENAAYTGGNNLSKTPFSDAEESTDRDMPDRVYSLAVSDTDDVLWAGGGNGRVWRMDPTTLDITETLSFSSSIIGLAWDGTYLWVGASEASFIRQYDPAAEETVATYNYPNAQTIYDYAFANERLWLEGDGKIFKTNINRSIPNDAPQAAFTVSPEDLTVGTSVTFDASASGDPDGTITSYEWDLTGDGSIDETGEIVSYTYDASGDYAVSLTVTDDDSGTDTTTTTVSVAEGNEPPQPSFSFSPETPEVGTSVTFDASASGDPDGTITSYEWDLTGDGSIDETGLTASTTYSEPGEYTPSLSVTDNDGETREISQTIVVNAAPTARLTVVPNNPDVGQEVTFRGGSSSDPDGSIEKYEWDLTGDGETDMTGPEVTRTYQSSGDFQITLTVIDGDGLSDQDRMELEVQSAQTTEPPESETTEPNDTESQEDTSDGSTTTKSETESSQQPGTQPESQETPGFGIGTAIAGLGSAAYIIKQRLTTEDNNR